MMLTLTDLGRNWRMLIGGCLVAAADETMSKTESPSTQEIIAGVPEAPILSLFSGRYPDTVIADANSRDVGFTAPLLDKRRLDRSQDRSPSRCWLCCG